MSDITKGWGPDPSVMQQNLDGSWSPAIPEPYYHRPLSWAWKRLTGWRDACGRKAHLLPVSEWFEADL